jgi:hypothetical protein
MGWIMLLRRLFTATLASGALMQVPAVADTLRCGSVLIQPGDDARYVLEKCGEPTMMPSVAVPAWSRNTNGYVFRSSVVRADRWRYQRAFGQFAVVLTIGDDGLVQAIDYETRRD